MWCVFVTALRGRAGRPAAAAVPLALLACLLSGAGPTGATPMRSYASTNGTELGKARFSCDASKCSSPSKTSYMTFEEMEYYLSFLEQKYPDTVHVRVEGTSHEGRNIYLVRITNPHRASYTGPQRIIFIEGGAHAREWISPATVFLLTHKLIRNCRVGRHCSHDFYIMPMLNPDGYEYSRLSDRYWRKNRSPPVDASGCYGTDLNRNWDYQWGVTGASTDPCDDAYRGQSPGSEPEIQAAVKVLQSLANDPDIQMDIYLSYHSYGQFVLHSWGYTYTLPSDIDDLRDMANYYASKVKKSSGKDYDVMSGADLYPASGASDDYAKNLGFKYSFTIELRDIGKYGFELPPSEIQSTFSENFAALKALAKKV